MAKPFNDKALQEPPLLSEEELAEIEVRAHQEAQKERKDAAVKQALDAALNKARGVQNHRALAHEEKVDVLIDLPGFAASIVINNVHYFHGRTYTVPISVAHDMRSMMARSWEHEDEVGGANRNAYRKPANATLRPGAN